MTARPLCAVLAVLALPAMAQDATPCFPVAQVSAELASIYGEQVMGLGLTKDGRAVALYLSPSTRTFTITVTTPAGQSCVIAAGIDWDQSAPEPPGEEG